MATPTYGAGADLVALPGGDKGVPVEALKSQIDAEDQVNRIAAQVAMVGFAIDISSERCQVNSETAKTFRDALNRACGEIDEAARLGAELFEGDEHKFVRRELARLLEIIDCRILPRLPGTQD
ncbi:MAG TPA: hypothetical protein VM555_06795 [Tahibacter sp.]|jgi:hypothetical protein|nr:hypothetical protein [Tahibacter sp.]